MVHYSPAAGAVIAKKFLENEWIGCDAAFLLAKFYSDDGDGESLFRLCYEQKSDKLCCYKAMLVSKCSSYLLSQAEM